MGVKEAKRRGTKEQERTGEQLGLIPEKASALKSQSDDPNTEGFFLFLWFLLSVLVVQI